MSHTIAERAYMAGFIDGEGAVMLRYFGKKYIALEVYVANTDIGVLRELQEIWGGSIVQTKTQKVSHKTCYRLHFFSKVATELLREIAPFLKVKRGQVAIALEFRETINPHLGVSPLSSNIVLSREKLKREMQELNFRGVRISL